MADTLSERDVLTIDRSWFCSVLAWGLMLTVIVLGLIESLFFSYMLVRAVQIVALICGLCFPVLWLNRSGRTKLACRLLAGFLWLICSALIATAGGLSAPAVPSYLLVIAIATLLVSERAGLLAAVFSAAFLLVLASLEQSGRPLTNYTHHTPLTRWFSFLILIVLTLIIQRLASQKVRTALRRARLELTERKRVEEELCELTEHMQLAVEAAEIGVWDWNLKTDKILCTDRIFEIYNWEKRVPPYLDLKEWERRVHPEDLAAQLTSLDRTRNGSRSGPREFRIVLDDGTIRHIQAAETLVASLNGKPGQIVGVNIDVTAKRRSEAILRESEERLALIFQNSSDVISLWTVENETILRLVSVNPACLELAGRTGNPFTETDVVGLTIEDFMRRIIKRDEASVVRNRQNVDQAISTKRPVRWVEVSPLATGSVYMERTDIPIIDPTGTCRHLLRVQHEITEQKKAEEALAASEVRFRSYFNLSSVGIAISSPAKEWIEVNDKLCEILGYAREEVINRSWTLFTHPDDLSESDGFYQQALLGKIDEYSFEKRFIRKDGVAIHTLLTSRCVRHAGGAVDYFLVLFQDITQRKIAETERAKAIAQEAAARKDFTRQLIASGEAERRRIASELHDSLGQNLLLIKNRAQLAAGDFASNAPLCEQLAAMSELASQSIAEVRQISHDLRPYQLDQLGLTRALEAMIANAAQSTLVSFERKLEPVDDLFDNEASTHIYRVVQESLNNIFKHSGASRVRIHLERDIHQIGLKIEDNGLGIHGGDGASGGFGIQNMAERVQILGGDFKMDSPEGTGTRLTIVIPIPNLDS